MKIKKLSNVIRKLKVACLVDQSNYQGSVIDPIYLLDILCEDIEKELISLNETMNKSIKDKSKILDFKDQLKNINVKLWEIENGKRLAEQKNDFGPKFIELARNVYKFNDERAKIKLRINQTLGSNIKEVKSHF